MVNFMSNFRLKLFTSSAIAALFFTGCNVGPRYHQPAATVQAPPIEYKEIPSPTQDSGDWKIAQPQDAMLHGKWWEIFNDAELNSLEDQLNINNQNIKQSFENFMEARTLIAEARAQLYPTLGTTPSYARTRSSANLGSASGSTGNTGAGGNQSSLYTLPVEAGWEPDLWGKVR